MERRRPSIIGPLILITIGVLFLLANMGALPLSFWEIAARYWPLIFILIGLEIIIGRSSIIGGLIVVVLWLAIVGGVLWYSMTQPNAFIQGGTTETISQPLGDIKSATVDLNIGFARTDVAALNSDSNDLMRGDFTHGSNVHIDKNYNVSGTEGRLALGENGANWTFGGPSTSRWDVKLYPQIPIALRINGGVGRATLDLSALNISSLNIDAGVGSVAVTTPKSAITTMKVNGGVGSVSIIIPQGVAARIRIDRGLGGSNIEQGRFPKSGDIYQSANYATAENKIDIEVDGGLGSISIR
ncbi:MAG: hypothetical protein HZB51_32245 [Chloroflexi bacterium]|nr:hypothetical protein [Chloroflexota bacterium]